MTGMSIELQTKQYKAYSSAWKSSLKLANMRILKVSLIIFGKKHLIHTFGIEFWAPLNHNFYALAESLSLEPSEEFLQKRIKNRTIFLKISENRTK